MVNPAYPPDHNTVPPIVKRKKVKWGVDTGVSIPAPPEEVFAAWVDGAQFAAITGKPAKGRAEVGAERGMLGDFARGSILELDPPRRVLEHWRSKHFPKDAPDSVLQVFFEPDPVGTKIHLKQWAYAKVPGRPLDYQTMMFWSQTLGAFRTHFASRGEEHVAAAAPPAGDRQQQLLSLLGEERPAKAWRSELVALVGDDPSPSWWRSVSPEQQGLEAWVRRLAPFGSAVLVRACVAAARAALPVWRVAAEEQPEGFAEVLEDFELEGGAPPSDILEAVGCWLREPSTRNREAATATLDPTAQLRYSDEDLGDLTERRFLYALEAARGAAYALREGEPADEAPLAAVCALEAIRASTETITDAELAQVCESIRRELVEWIEDS